MVLKKNLKKLIQERDINASQLARAVNLNVKTVHNWLSGQSPRNIEDIKRVADYFAVSVDYLCFDKKTETIKQTKIEDFTDEINAGIFEVVLRRVKKG